MTFGSNVKRLRIESGFTQQELADLAHVTQSTISNLETATGGRSIDAALAKVEAIARALGVAEGDLRE